MEELRELQLAFMAQMNHRDSPSDLAIRDDGAISAAMRLQIYRNNISSIHRNALAGIYPALLALTGKEYFYQVASEYLQFHPANGADLKECGKEISAWLATLQTILQDYPYLPGVARLEWLIHESFHEASVWGEDLQSFDQLHEEMIQGNSNLYLVTHPSLRLLATDYDLLGIWRFALGKQDTPANSQPQKQWLWILRKGIEVHIDRLGELEFMILRDSHAGHSLATLCDEYSEHMNENAMLAILHRHIALGALVGYRKI